MKSTDARDYLETCVEEYVSPDKEYVTMRVAKAALDIAEKDLREKAVAALKRSCIHKSRSTRNCTLGLHRDLCDGDCYPVKGFLEAYDNETHRK